MYTLLKNVPKSKADKHVGHLAPLAGEAVSLPSRDYYYYETFMDPEREIKHRLDDRREKILHFRLTKRKGMQLQSIVIKTTGTSSLRKFIEEIVIPTFSSNNKQMTSIQPSINPRKYHEPFMLQLKGCAKNLNQFMAFLNTKIKEGAVSDDAVIGYCQRLSRIIDNLKIIMESENYHIDQ